VVTTIVERSLPGLPSKRKSPARKATPIEMRWLKRVWHNCWGMKTSFSSDFDMGVFLSVRVGQRA
jgi:hypothetical protein